MQGSFLMQGRHGYVTRLREQWTIWPENHPSVQFTSRKGL
jgi:hypothetical protein